MLMLFSLQVTRSPSLHPTHMCESFSPFRAQKGTISFSWRWCDESPGKCHRLISRRCNKQLSVDHIPKLHTFLLVLCLLSAWKKNESNISELNNKDWFCRVCMLCIVCVPTYFFLSRKIPDNFFVPVWRCCPNYPLT